jgi:membrane-bound ClpP family serine protease
MADWISVLLLILCGVVLIIIELIFVPGTTILGILGVVSMVGGVVIAFTNFGRATGFWVLTGTILFSILALVYSLRAGTWQRFALKSKIESRVNEDEKLDLQIGMQGKLISDLRPMGTAEFLDKLYEVQTNGNYLEAGGMVEIINLADNKIVVKPI